LHFNFSIIYADICRNMNYYIIDIKIIVQPLAFWWFVVRVCRKCCSVGGKNNKLNKFVCEQINYFVRCFIRNLGKGEIIGQRIEQKFSILNLNFLFKSVKLRHVQLFMIAKSIYWVGKAFSLDKNAKFWFPVRASSTWNCVSNFGKNSIRSGKISALPPWRVKTSGCENSHATATEVNSSNIPQKS
jgi:hypothetical protein